MQVVKCVVLASPAHIKDQFWSYMLAEAQKKDYKDILENKGKFLLVHAPTGHKYVLLIVCCCC